MSRINFRRQLLRKLEELMPLAVEANKKARADKTSNTNNYYAAGKMNGLVEAFRAAIDFYDHCERVNNKKIITKVDNLIDAAKVFNPKGSANGKEEKA